MDRRIVEFVSALRAAGVRISLAESADAFNAVDQLGVQDREIFRVVLRSTLVKDGSDLAVFDQLFPLFFQAGSPPPMTNPSQELTPEEARAIADILKDMNNQLRRMLEKLLEGRPFTPDELRQLDRLLNNGDVNDLRYQNWAARQMEQALNFKEVRQALEELMQTLRQMGMDRERVDQLRQMMQANQEALQDQLRQHAGQRIVENMSRMTRQDRMDNLFNRPFHLLTEDEMFQLRKEVRRLAAILRTRMALRMKRAKSGHLDVKATLRANMKHANVPIELRYRDHTLKPKIVVLCDVSTSMRYISELMLGLLYSIQDQISKTHAFAFIDHLEYISPQLDEKQPDQAVSQILRRMPAGHYNTDLGYSLKNLVDDYLNTIDSRTILIVVGDGRNNFNDPRTDLFRMVSRRSRNAIWLNPEPVALWGSGDSDMQKYEPYCRSVFQVANLAQLAEAIDHLLLQHD
jgi:uncharacterized protein with von Willebrand factor type A (vWA) domain